MVAVEFGLLVFPILGVILGLLQTSLDYYLIGVLDNTTQNAARLIMVGEAQRNNLATAAKLRDELCKTTPHILSCESLIVDVQKLTQFAGSDSLTEVTPPASIEAAHFDIGAPGEYNLVQAYYPAPFFSIYGATNVTTIDGKRVRRYRQTAVIRVE